MVPVAPPPAAQLACPDSRFKGGQFEIGKPLFRKVTLPVGATPPAAAMSRAPSCGIASVEMVAVTVPAFD